MTRFSISLAVFAAALTLSAEAHAAPGASAAPDSSSAQSTVPDQLQGMVGDWTLAQEDDNAPTCPLTFTDQQTTGGWAVNFPEACDPPFPATSTIKAWNVDDNDGSVLLLDGSKKVVLKLLEDDDGLFDTDPNSEPRFFLLSPADANGNGGEDDFDD